MHKLYMLKEKMASLMALLVKACNVGDLGSIPGLEISLG